jgi:hypothetical protein
MSTVFILKPIIDVLYEEVNEYKKEIERLNKIIDELKNRKTDTEVNRKVSTRAKNNVKPVKEVQIYEISDSEDDEIFAKEAEAPPTSSPATVIGQVEKHEEPKENVTINNDDVKNVKMINGKNAKEYMKEYQRNYRKKQKENLQNILINKITV